MVRAWSTLFIFSTANYVCNLGRIPALLPYHIGFNPCFPKSASGWSIGIELVCAKGSVGINSTKRLMTIDIDEYFIVLRQRCQLTHGKYRPWESDRYGGDL